MAGFFFEKPSSGIWDNGRVRRFPVIRTLFIAAGLAIAVGFDAHGQPRAANPRTTGGSRSSGCAGVRIRRFPPGRRRRRLEPRLPARRAAPRPHPQGADVARHPHRRQPDPGARRSRAVQVPDRVHVGAGVLEPHRSRSRRRSAPTCSRAASRCSRTSTARSSGATSRRRCAACCPDGRFVKLDSTHRIFDSFFKIKDIDAIVHPMTGIASELLRDLRGQRSRRSG